MFNCYQACSLAKKYSYNECIRLIFEGSVFRLTISKNRAKKSASIIKDDPINFPGLSGSKNSGVINIL